MLCAGSWLSLPTEEAGTWVPDAGGNFRSAARALLFTYVTVNIWCENWHYNTLWAWMMVEDSRIHQAKQSLTPLSQPVVSDHSPGLRPQVCCGMSQSGRRAQQIRLWVMRVCWGVNCQLLGQRVFSLLPFVQHLTCQDPCPRPKLLGAVT